MSVRSDFWSRRKAQVEAEAEAERATREAEADAARMAEREAQSDAALLAELDLPDPDTLGPGDDFSAFMARAVPDRLRRRALRKLWLTNPVLANVDGLVDYGEDFTDAACVLENMQTAYQVGKGMTKHVEEMARQAELAEAGGDAEDAAEDDPEAEADDLQVAPDPDPEPLVLADAAETEADTQGADEGAVMPARRRMRFTFTDQPGEHA